MVVLHSFLYFCNILILLAFKDKWEASGIPLQAWIQVGGYQNTQNGETQI